MPEEAMSESSSRDRSLSLALLLLVVGFVIGWLGALEFQNRKGNIEGPHRAITMTERERSDSATLAIEIPIKPITIESRSNHLAKSNDDSSFAGSTIYRLDTILIQASSIRDSSLAHSFANERDTISIRHILPADSFSVEIKLAPRDTIARIHFVAHDSIILRQDTITLRDGSSHEWYEEPLKILAALLTGFLFGSLKHL